MSVKYTDASKGVKRLKLLLVNLTAPQWRVTGGKAPKTRTKAFRFSMLSSLCVASSVPSYVATRIIDEDVEPVDFDIDADLIGISFMTYNAPRAYEIAEKFRREKGKTVLFGGYHPTFMPEEAIQHADSVCIGEAENNVPHMVEDFLAGRLRRFYKNGPADLRGLPVPDRNLIRKSAYVISDALQATRGCPNRCRFCSITAFFGGQFRARPVDEVIDELRSLGKYTLFLDDNITADRGYAKDLFQRMIPLGKRWFSQCSVRIAYDDELLRLASLSGCRGMFIGFESISQDNLSGCNKGFNKADDYVWAVERLHARGIGVYAGIVFGMDGDTPGIFSSTLDFLHKAKVDALQATILTPFPGTPLFEDMESQGRIIDRDWARYDFGHVVFEPKNMSPETLKRGHDRVLSEFYSKRAMLRRVGRSLGYLSPWTALHCVLPLNLNYRSRLAGVGAFEGLDNSQEERR
jgi:radical SAM superfamily enzyme YgiQ (UPF0313 family)